MEHGANLNGLHYACQSPVSLRGVKYFVGEKVVPIDAQADGTQGTALHVACGDGELEVMQYLMADGAHLNALMEGWGMTPLSRTFR